MFKAQNPKVRKANAASHVKRTGLKVQVKNKNRVTKGKAKVGY